MIMEVVTLKDKVQRDVLILEAGEAEQIANMLDAAYHYPFATGGEGKALIKRFISCVGEFVIDRKRRRREVRK